MPYVAGVDLGTTYSAAAVAGPDGAQSVDLDVRATVMPSVVAIRADGEILTGAPAERRLVLEPSRAAREFKRRLGDPTPLLLGGVPYGAEALTGKLLRSIVDLITERQAEPPALVGLSHPANYGSYRLGLLEEAARIAEIPVAVFVPEPVAAAVHYSMSERIEVGDVLGVYDLGGGTFDASVVRRTEEGFEVIGKPDGMDRFGGIDMDEAVLGHVREVLGDALGVIDPSDPVVISALARLRDECRTAKEVLSGDTDVAIPVMLPGLHTEVRLTRAEFEDMIRPRIRDTLTVFERTVSSSGVEPGDLARVLLVGGSSRIPLVGEMVRLATGRPVGLDTHPKLSVALGTARVAVNSLGAKPAPPPAVVGTAPEVTPDPIPEPVEPEPEPAEPEPAEPEPVESEPEPAFAPEAEEGPSELVSESEQQAEEAVPPEPKHHPESVAAGSARGGRRWLLAVAALLAVAVVVVLGIALSGGNDDPVPIAAPDSTTAAATATTSPVGTEVPAPPSTGPLENSERVLALYYTMWETEDYDGAWYIWDDNGSSPPEDICCDFYPSLGPYSSNDPQVLYQHFAWFNQAGIGIVGLDWWGEDSRGDQQVPMILDAAEQYGLKVAFVINEYGGRSVDNLADSVEYLYGEYGNHAAFYRTEEESLYQGGQSKGVFLLWRPFAGSVSAGDWAVATDEIRQLPQGAIVLAEGTDLDLIHEGGFDGLFNPPDPNIRDFSWAMDLPDKAWYVPAVIPGFEKLKQGLGVIAGRSDGAFYLSRWEAVLGTGVEPALVAVGTFNDWRNGTQIEPAAAGRTNGGEFLYAEYGGLGEEGYLDLTAQHVEALDEAFPSEPIPLRITFTSSSDHATAYFFDGQWIRPTERSFIGADGDLRDINRENGTLFGSLHQELERAQAGDALTVVFDVQLVAGESDARFSIWKGCIGTATVTVHDTRGSTPTLILDGEAPEPACDTGVLFTIPLADLGLGG